MTGGSLTAVPPLLRVDPALPALLGSADGTLAVAAPGQSVLLAALARFTERAPLLVVTATGVDADRLADDLTCLLEGGASDDEVVVGAIQGPVAVLPAWETLPFERVSPEVETMGRRLALLWGLTHGGAESGLPPAPRVIVAPIRALLQRLGPYRQQGPPVVVRPGQEIASEELITRLVQAGYRREHQVEHRGELAVRGGIIDVFPSTADQPVRIDLWGDEVDRLTAFAINDQRSSFDLTAAVLYGCRELLPTDDVRAQAASLVAGQPWGARHWERLAEGETFDGMESWLPYVYPTEELLPDLLPATSQVVLVEPRRIRDRAVHLLEEEAALAQTLATTWGAGDGSGEGFPRLHLPYERLLEMSPSGVLALPTTADGPSTTALTVRGLNPVAGDPARLAGQVTQLVAEGYAVTLCAATAAGAVR
ncbi:MAG TPA: transcription-repair coupling factor, partial [Acidimicrobiales bacterium]|nr:transcription-repair coupling factor [Acidimicrobiales bacterium]